MLRGSAPGVGSRSAAQGTCLYRHLPSHARQQTGMSPPAASAAPPAGSRRRPGPHPSRSAPRAGASTSGASPSARRGPAVASREDLSLEPSSSAELYAFRQRLSSRLLDVQMRDADLRSFAQGAQRGEQPPEKCNCARRSLAAALRARLAPPRPDAARVRSEAHAAARCAAPQ